MAKKIVGLIGNGRGPVVHTEGNCIAVVEGLQAGGLVVVSVDSGEQFVILENSRLEIGKPKHVIFEASDASRELICNVLMES
jgi:hypothetical protein